MNVLLVVQITVYLLALVLALCISVPVMIHQKDFKYNLFGVNHNRISHLDCIFFCRGHCLLFSRGTWRETDGIPKSHL